MYGASDFLLLGAYLHFFTVVDTKVAKTSGLRGQGGQARHVEEVVDFSGFGSRWPRCPSYFEFFRRIRKSGEYFVGVDDGRGKPRITRMARIPRGIGLGLLGCWRRSSPGDDAKRGRVCELRSAYGTQRVVLANP